MVKAWAKRTLGGLALAALVGLALLLAELRERDSRLPRLALTLPQERQRARSVGLPRALAELPLPPAVPASHNAALHYRAAVGQLPEWTDAERQAVRRFLERETQGLDQDRPLLAALLDRSTAAVARARAGTRLPKSQFDWGALSSEADWRARREVLVGCDRIALTLQVYALGSRTQPQRALEVLRVSERLTRHLTREGGLLVWQSRAAQARYSARLLALLARENPALRSQILRELEPWNLPPDALKQAWLLQCVKEQGDAERARTKRYKPESEPFLDYNPLWRELDRLDFVLGWRLYADASEVSQLRYWRRVKAALATAPQTLEAQAKALETLDREERAYVRSVPGYWTPLRYGDHAALLVQAQRAVEQTRQDLKTLPPPPKRRGRR